MSAASAFYRDSGFVGLAGVFDDQAIESIRQSVERAAVNRATVSSRYFARLDEENSFNTSYRQYANLHEQDVELASFVHSATVGNLVQGVAGEGLCFLFSSTLEKQPFAGPLRAHHDLRQMPFDTETMVTAWIALDDVDARNGCLYYFPGTQRMGVRRAKDSAKSSFKDSSIDYLRFYSEFDEVEPVFAEVPRGTVLFHNGMTIHGSGANLSRRPRMALALSFIPLNTVCTDPDHPLLRDFTAGESFSDNPWHPRVVAASSPAHPPVERM
jgi:ectoine hydroxylase-related dioxygenase (phytanoyl-CoA dioxygenase family)